MRIKRCNSCYIHVNLKQYHVLPTRDRGARSLVLDTLVNVTGQVMSSSRISALYAYLGEYTNTLYQELGEVQIRDKAFCGCVAC